MEESFREKLERKEPGILPYIKRFEEGAEVVEYVREGVRFVLTRVRPGSDEQRAEAQAEGKESYVQVEVYKEGEQVAECTTDIPGMHNLLWSIVPKMAQRAWDIKCGIDGIPAYEQHQRISGIMFWLKNGYIPISLTERISPLLNPAKVRKVRKTFEGDRLLDFSEQYSLLKQLAFLAEKSRGFGRESIIGPMEFSCRIRFKHTGTSTRALYKAMKDQDDKAIEIELRKIHEVMNAT